MKKYILLLLLACTGCQTAKIANEKYRVSTSTTELGSIGIADTKLAGENTFSTRTFPQLKNRIRLEIKALPFDKKINAIYLSKKETALSEKPEIHYTDSLSKKPEYLIVSIMDVTGLVNELNSDYNNENRTFLKNTGNASLVNSVALVFPEKSIQKIKEADAYYLVNNLEKKYTITLYKNGQQYETIDMQQSLILAYRLGRFCWVENSHHVWSIGDIVDDNNQCLGSTSEKIKKKENIDPFKM